MTGTSMIAVALHDVSPETFAECKRIRSWLYARGIERATLLAIPASGGTPFYSRSAGLASWLKEQAAAGDAVAQHGYEHRQHTHARSFVHWLARRQGAGSAEFAGLNAQETATAVARGRQILEEAGIDIRGFVAPAYFYTPNLRRQLAGAFEWWADLLALYTHSDAPLKPRRRLAPAACLGTSTRPKRLLSPPLVNALSRLPSTLLRIDVHPADFNYRRHITTLESVLAAAHTRRAVSYQDVAGRRQRSEPRAATRQ